MTGRIDDADAGVAARSAATIDVIGRPNAEELAAVLAVLGRCRSAKAVDPYARWRRTRLAAVRRSLAPADAGRAASA